MSELADIIYIDPPWQYNDRKKERKDGKQPKFGIGAGNHYDCMSTRDISRIPVEQICKKNSALFLWATYPMLQNALDVMKAWGFRYINVFNWRKLNKQGGSFFGVGYYMKSNEELLMMGVKGKMKPIVNNISQVIETTHPRYLDWRHSRKPEEFRDAINRLFGSHLTRVELFARKHSDESYADKIYQDGWIRTGLEYDGLDVFEFCKQFKSGVYQVQEVNQLETLGRVANF